MKKKILILLFLITSIVTAQFNIGVVGGLNSTGISGDSPPHGNYSSNLGFNFGAILNYHFSKDIILEIQPGYSKKSTTIQYSVDYQYDKFDSLKLEINYLEIPFNIKVIADNEIAFVTAGLVFSFPLSGDITNFRTENKTDIKENLESMILGLSFGAGFQIDMGVPTWFVEFRYSQSLTNLTNGSIKNSPIELKIRSNSWQILTGLLFEI